MKDRANIQQAIIVLKANSKQRAKEGKHQPIKTKIRRKLYRPQEKNMVLNK